MKYYKVGDKLRVKSIDWYNKRKDNVFGTVFDTTPHFIASMSKYCGQVATITKMICSNVFKVSLDGGDYDWENDMFEGLVEEETTSNIIEETKSNCDNINNIEQNEKVAICADKECVFYGTIVRKDGDEVVIKDKIMKRANVKELLPIIEAYGEGKTIQFFSNDKGWVDREYLNFSEEPYLYRIKPEPKYRPFKSREECWNEMQKHKPFCWVICIKTGNFEQITYVGPNIVSMSDTNPYFSTAFENYKFADGSYFGIKEE